MTVAPAAQLSQETLALTKRLFVQLQRRPSTLVAGVLQPLIWLVLFGALFANAPDGLIPGGVSYGRFLGAGVIVFTAFSAALNAGLPVMFDREFGFLNRLLVAPLRSRYSIVLASVPVFSLAQSRPSLDDVYLQATGRTLMDAELASVSSRDPKAEKKKAMR